MADRSVLITGGTGGLGGAVTAAFIADGWRVVVPSRHDTWAPDAVEMIAGVDLDDPVHVARAVDAAAGAPDAPLRAVVHLVGGYSGGPRVHDLPVADFESQFALNLRPTYLVTQAALPHLIAGGGGSIVCTSSRAAVAPFSGAAGYIVSKAAVVAFAQTVAVEYRDDGVRCNAVLPSVIDTAANRASQPGADYSRWVSPAEIAGVIRFLAGPDSAPISGAMVPVYGRA
jgi:NAD(P)-dependent dehydrogenase (short-subunit alcohol dehydrogenase family)